MSRCVSLNGAPRPPTSPRCDGAPVSVDTLAPPAIDVEVANPPAPIDAPVPRRSRRLLAAARRPGVVLAAAWLLLIAVAAFVPRLLTSVDPLATSPKSKLQSPSWTHLFGTDQLGRDLFSRIVYGAGLSLRTALLAVAVGLVVGALSASSPDSSAAGWTTC